MSNTKPENQTAYYQEHPPKCVASFLAEPAKLDNIEFDGHGSSGIYPHGLVAVSKQDNQERALMDSVACVTSAFIVLGLICLLAPEQVAHLGVRLDSTNQASAREILKRYARATRRTGRIVGSIFVIAGLLILLASRP